ncbi:MAG: DUF4340 domain-containing protein, partial [Verrucomicrobiota bacterium]
AGGPAKLLGDFPLNDVAQVTIKNKDGEVTLRKVSDLWRVKERGDYLANFDQISEFIRKAWELKPVQQPKVGQSHLARLELAEPGKGDKSGTLVEFKNKDGKSIGSLMLGKQDMKEGDSQFGGGGFPTGRFVMVPGKLETVSLVSESFSSVDVKPDQWLNKDFFKVEKLREVAVTHTNAASSWRLVREKEGGDWKLADAKKDEELDTSKTFAYNSLFSSPSFEDVAKPDAKPEDLGLDKPFAVTLGTFDNFTYTMKLGVKDEEHQYLKFDVAGSFSKTRTAGENEKPEDKEKLDKEHADKVKQLEEKLKKEQEFSKWTYEVAKWTVDALLKERKELLKEKKEDDGKKEDKPAGEDKKEAKPPAP